MPLDLDFDMTELGLMKTMTISYFKAPHPSFRIDHDPLEYLVEEREKR